MKCRVGRVNERGWEHVQNCKRRYQSKHNQSVRVRILWEAKNVRVRRKEEKRIQSTFFFTSFLDECGAKGMYGDSWSLVI